MLKNIVWEENSRGRLIQPSAQSKVISEVVLGTLWYFPVTSVQRLRFHDLLGSQSVLEHSHHEKSIFLMSSWNFPCCNRQLFPLVLSLCATERALFVLPIISPTHWLTFSLLSARNLNPFPQSYPVRPQSVILHRTVPCHIPIILTLISILH